MSLWSPTAFLFEIRDAASVNAEGEDPSKQLGVKPCYLRRISNVSGNPGYLISAIDIPDEAISTSGPESEERVPEVFEEFGGASPTVSDSLAFNRRRGGAA
jgi:hypothetical protein